MLIDRLVKKCNERYKSKQVGQCKDCEFGNNCPEDCEICLKYIHTPTCAPDVRNYDCEHMADCYFCKYVYRYASEIVYALKRFKDIQKKDKLNIMSVGCGPCTELCAIDYLHEIGVYTYSKVEYQGIDPLEDVWQYIHKDIKHHLKNDEILFFYSDILKLIDIIVEGKWVPDLIIFQYVFSDMYKKYTKVEIEEFIRKLARFLNKKAKKPVYILANDINLSIAWDGGREFFDILGKELYEPKAFFPLHFDIKHKDRHYEYGEEYNSNSLFFEIPAEIKELYNPYDSCGSAQALMKRW